MDNNSISVLFKYIVNFANPTIVEAKKKYKLFNGIICLICGLIFIGFSILAGMQKNPSIIAVLIFAGISALAIGFSIYYFVTMKVSLNDEHNDYEFIFTEIGMVVNQNNKLKNTSRNLTNCLYRNYRDKQYIARIIEDDKKFLIKVYTGTINLIPQYKKYNLPKDVIEADKLDVFRSLLKQVVTKDFITK